MCLGWIRMKYLYTDASRGTGTASGMIGWGLTQQDNNGNEAPIAFGLGYYMTIKKRLSNRKELPF